MYFGSLYLLHFRDVTDKGSILNEVIQLLKLTKILHIVLPDHLKQVKQTKAVYRVEEYTAADSQL